MFREYCPKCQELQNMNISNYESTKKDEKDQEIKVTVKNHQCSVCHSFVKSEEIENPINNPAK